MTISACLPSAIPRRKTPTRLCQRTLSPGHHFGLSRPVIGAARRVFHWLALRGSPAGNICLSRHVFDPLRREIIRDVSLAQHVATENAIEGRCIFRLLELKMEADLAIREEGHHEQTRLDSMVVEPRPHLGHGGAQVGALAPDLNKGHTVRPPERDYG